METGIYVALSSQVALEQRLATLADNVANSNTVGFRATEIKFEEVLQKSGDTSVNYVDTGREFLSEQNGALAETGNSFDVAIRGNAYFQVQTPQGPALTRDGRFSLTPAGQIVTVQGYPVLDAGGAPIQVATTGSTQLGVGKDGSIQLDGKRVASLGLFEANMNNGYVRVGGSAFIPNGGSQAVVDRIEAGVIQGFVEESNVNPVQEMTRLIMVQRNFEDVSAMMQKSETSLEDAIKTLGSK
jgi:flagellar basal-body rod protein FlgF